MGAGWESLYGDIFLCRLNALQFKAIALPLKIIKTKLSLCNLRVTQTEGTFILNSLLV